MVGRYRGRPSKNRIVSRSHDILEGAVPALLSGPDPITLKSQNKHKSENEPQNRNIETANALAETRSAFYPAAVRVRSSATASVRSARADAEPASSKDPMSHKK